MNEPSTSDPKRDSNKSPDRSPARGSNFTSDPDLRLDPTSEREPDQRASSAREFTSTSSAASATSSAPSPLTVLGMDCGACATTVEAAVRRVDGVSACSVDFAGETLAYEGDADPEAVRAAVRAAGFVAPAPSAEGGAVQAASSPEQAAAGGILGFLRWTSQRPETRLILIAAPLALPGLIFGEILQRGSFWVDVSSLAAAAIAGVPVMVAAWRALTVSRRITIHVLMTVATFGAIGIGAFAEAGMLMVLFGVGEALEGWSAGRAREAIRSLAVLAPETAVRLRRADATPVPCGRETVPAAQLMVGDEVLVLPGERLPADGEVIAGASSIDQAAVTGESVPVIKEAGAAVFAATVNGEGALEIRVSRAADESVVARIARMVTKARANRAPIERLVDRFAARYTPTVVLVAAAVAFLPPLLLGQPLLGEIGGRPAWLYRGLALLVVACPCALVIGTPVAVVSAIGAAARRGVLIKGGEAMERLARVHAITFDKTGTLTMGEPEVVGIVSADCLPAVAGLACAVPRRTSATALQSATGAMNRAGDRSVGDPEEGSTSAERAATANRSPDGANWGATNGSTSAAAGNLEIGSGDGSADDSAHGSANGSSNESTTSSTTPSTTPSTNGERCDACDDLLSLAGAVERRSEHPLARAVVAAEAARGGIRLPDAESVVALPGRGVRGRVGARDVLVASHRHFDEAVPHDAALCASIEADAALGLTPMLVGSDGTYLGRINLSDAVRDSAPEAVAALRRRLGDDAVVMLTGDGPAAARLVGDVVGVLPEHVYDSLMPEDKPRIVQQVRAKHGAVMMIGDGINDTPALAVADVGVAMGGPRGSAQAMETADIALMNDDLRRVPWAIDLAKAGRRRVREIIGVTIAIKIGYALLTVVGLGTLWGAVLADVGASVLATVMGLRLLRWRGDADLGGPTAR